MINKLHHIILSILFFQVGFFSTFAQEVKLQGKVIDTLQQPLEYTNVLAIPQSNDLSIEFSICDEKGNYQLHLVKNSNYTIEISYLGYQKLSYPITLQENKKKDFVLTNNNESLDEITINYKYQPVIVKKDTIIYDTSVFTNGKEQKLREVLKKLPGVEVDKAGNITVNGKKVSKFMVEGELFFTGDTKLGVNNIPADVVDKVEVFDNYTDIPFLKGLNDSEAMALNIKLKEGNKNFAFGDLKAGGGVKDKYLISPTLFYYSPKTSINFIGDINNTGGKSFTFNDYITFEGGFAKLMENPSGYSNLFTNDFAKYLNNTDFTFNSNKFGAFNISHRLSAKTKLTAYSIVNGSTTKTKKENQNTYLVNNQITNIEEREIKAKVKTLFSLHKLNLNYIPNMEEDLKYEILIKTSKNKANEFLQSLSFIDTNSVTTKTTHDSFELLQNIGYSKQFSYKHTSTLQAQFNILRSNTENDWLLRHPVFNKIIPVQGESPYNLIQKTEATNYETSLVLKHYWVLNNFNHIYPIVGHNYSQQEYSSFTYQFLDNTNNSLDEFGFNNQTKFNLNNSFIGFQYKAKVGKLIFKPSLTYHYYYWYVQQFSNNKQSASKKILQPELLVKMNIKDSEKLTLKYHITSYFKDASYFANRLRLQRFNSVYRGNNSLENTFTHNASFRYYKFNLLKGIFLNTAINYTKKVKSTVNEVVLEDINQINTSRYSNLPENTLFANATFSKKIKKIKYTVSGSSSFSDYSRKINNITEDYKSSNVSYSISAETYFKKYPNIEVGFLQTFTTFSSQSFNSNFSQTNPFLILDYSFLKHFLIKADYTYNYYEDRNNNEFNIFQLGNFSIIYHKEDSLWSFELETKNIFDVNYKNNNSLNQFIINDTKTFIQSRIILFKLTYKL